MKEKVIKKKNKIILKTITILILLIMCSFMETRIVYGTNAYLRNGVLYLGYDQYNGGGFVHKFNPGHLTMDEATFTPDQLGKFKVTRIHFGYTVLKGKLEDLANSIGISYATLEEKCTVTITIQGKNTITTTVPAFENNNGYIDVAGGEVEVAANGTLKVNITHNLYEYLRSGTGKGDYLSEYNANLVQVEIKTIQLQITEGVIDEITSNLHVSELNGTKFPETAKGKIPQIGRREFIEVRDYADNNEMGTCALDISGLKNEQDFKINITAYSDRSQPYKGYVLNANCDVIGSVNLILSGGNTKEGSIKKSELGNLTNAKYLWIVPQGKDNTDKSYYIYEQNAKFKVKRSKVANKYLCSSDGTDTLFTNDMKYSIKATVEIGDTGDKRTELTNGTERRVFGSKIRYNYDKPSVASDVTVQNMTFSGTSNYSIAISNVEGGDLYLYLHKKGANFINASDSDFYSKKVVKSGSSLTVDLKDLGLGKGDISNYELIIIPFSYGEAKSEGYKVHKLENTKEPTKPATYYINPTSLSAGQTITANITVTKKDDELGDSNLQPVTESEESPDDSGGNTEVAGAIERQDKPGIVESLLNSLFHALGWLVEQVLNIAFNTAAGGTEKMPTVDSIVFNASDDGWKAVRIDYFRTGTDASVAGKLKDTVSTLYVSFVAIAVIAYAFILVYTGMRIVMASLSTEKAKYKQMFMHWITGLLLLFVGHYAMGIIVEINDAASQLVQQVAIKQDSGGKVANMQTYFKQKGWSTDYHRKAWHGGREDYKGPDLVKTIIWIILLGKTITLAIFYIKRLLMITFLIIIFPLVTISYALDKMGDGKSQILDAWFKEYLVNVLMNLMHGITYALVVGIAVGAMGG